MHHAAFTVICDSVTDASILFHSLSPEIQQTIPKTKIVCQQDQNKVHLSVTASDSNALRAACNSYLRWLHTASQISQML